MGAVWRLDTACLACAVVRVDPLGEDAGDRCRDDYENGDGDDQKQVCGVHGFKFARRAAQADQPPG